MIVKKLAAPLINEKILLEAVHCSIATAGLTEAAFDMVMNKLPRKCKLEIVTGLDLPTTPRLLKRILEHFPDRVTLQVYTRNTFNANAYIIDLPFRKSVAFVGSGSFTLEGLKDNEELFEKIMDAKEIETMKSWFIGYYEFSEPLTHKLIDEYATIYSSMQARLIASRLDKRRAFELGTRAFNLDNIKFKTQFFKKDHYQALASHQARLVSDDVQTQREMLRQKLLSLHEAVRPSLKDLRFYANDQSPVSSLDPSHHPDHALRTMWLSYGRSSEELSRYGADIPLQDMMRLQLALQQKDFNVLIVMGHAREGHVDREYVQEKIKEEAYAVALLTLLDKLGTGYWIEVAGDKRGIESFQQADALAAFLRNDDWQYYSFLIGRNFFPGDADISEDNVATTIVREATKLQPVYRHLLDASYERK